MNPTQQQIDELKAEVAFLKKTLGLDTSMEERVRDIIFFDVDNMAATTRSATVSLGLVTVPVNPTKFARAYVKGQVWGIALYPLS